jgi:hypothetical protein
MAIIETPSLSLQDAIARQADVYDVWVHYWGTRIDVNNLPSLLGIDSYPYFTQPGLPNSLAGIAIGPESMVDRCWISTNPSKDVAQLNRTADLVRGISVEQPLLFTQAAKRAPSLSNTISPYTPTNVNNPWLAQSQGLMYVVANIQRQGASNITSTEVPPSYLKEDGTVVTLNPIPPGINAKWIPPTLQLRLLLRPDILVSTKRMPQIFGNVDNATTALAGLGEVLIQQVPIYGRKNVVVKMRGNNAAGGDTFTFRAAVLRTMNYSATVQEETVGERTETADAGGLASVRFHICNPAAAYLMLYAETSGNGRISGWTVGLED